MEKEFIPYEQALALKELGFNEPCIRYYWTDGMFSKTYNEPFNYSKKENTISAPLYQQAFRWFREKYNLDSWVYKSRDYAYFYSILRDSRYLSANVEFISHEEAELECLKKLIEIVKNK
jgi:hypothetical protein